MDPLPWAAEDTLSSGPPTPALEELLPIQTDAEAIRRGWIGSSELTNSHLEFVAGVVNMCQPGVDIGHPCAVIVGPSVATALAARNTQARSEWLSNALGGPVFVSIPIQRSIARQLAHDHWQLLTLSSDGDTELECSAGWREPVVDLQAVQETLEHYISSVTAKKISWKPLVVRRVPLQTNDFDCGAFVAAFMAHRAATQGRSIEQWEGVTAIRPEAAAAMARGVRTLCAQLAPLYFHDGDINGSSSNDSGLNPYGDMNPLDSLMSVIGSALGLPPPLLPSLQPQLPPSHTANMSISNILCGPSNPAQQPQPRRRPLPGPSLRDAQQPGNPTPVKRRRANAM
ncbi:hypothetical protein HK405_005696, partial [Cladochytrium tenue]